MDDGSETDVQLRIQREIHTGRLRFVGNYEIIRPIGQGAFSTVYLAVHTITKHEVVLKSADKSLANLAAEITNLKGLWHPHIAHLYEYVITSDKVWLALEYCAGEELFEWLTAHTVMPPVRARKLFAQLSGALAFSHARHCAHRDIKLENVLLDDKGNAKLGDFGFTRSYVPRTMLETVCGTEPYMAPELLRRRKYWPEAVDVWSLGIIFYATLFGQLPFDEESPSETMRRVIEEEPSWDLPEKQKSIVSSQLLEVVRRMLAKDPKARPRAEDILKDPALGEFGATQLRILREKPPKPFSSQYEKRLLKALKVMNVDVRALAISVVQHSCDPLHGLWFTALDHRRTLDAPSSPSIRTRSPSVGARSLRTVRSARSFSNRSTVSARSGLSEPSRSVRSLQVPSSDDFGIPPVPNTVELDLDTKSFTFPSASSYTSQVLEEPPTHSSPTPLPKTHDHRHHRFWDEDRKEKPFEKLWSAITRRAKNSLNKPQQSTITASDRRSESLPINNLLPLDSLPMTRPRTPSLEERTAQASPQLGNRPLSMYSQLSQASQLSEASNGSDSILRVSLVRPTSPDTARFLAKRQLPAHAPPGSSGTRSGTESRLRALKERFSARIEEE